MMKFFEGYLTNCVYVQKRDGDEDQREELRKKFVAAQDIEMQNGICGNVAAHVKISVKTKKATFSKDWVSNNGTSVSLYQALPSALALYRLCCFDGIKVEAFGPDGYKCVWSTALVHADTGRRIWFGEHKGGFSFWMPEHSASDLPEGLKQDLLDFLTYLVGDTCAHPYDGTVAGSVA
jgi:hypothetical protein